MRQRLLSGAVYGLTTALGVLAFLYPFFVPITQSAGSTAQAHSNDAPLLLAVLVTVCFAALLLQVQMVATGAKVVAFLGILVAMNSMLRFLDASLPGAGGFSPVFALIVLTGYAYGGGIGFLLGSLTLLVSAFMTGGIGPWLPYQMLAAGWVGLSAPVCRPLVRLIRGVGRMREVVVLAVFGGVWGMLFGVIMNLWFWPYVTGSASYYWQPGIGVGEVIQRYLVFYVATSAWWDLCRLVGNSALLLAFGLPTLRVLGRFRRRFSFEYTPIGADAG